MKSENNEIKNPETDKFIYLNNENKLLMNLIILHHILINIMELYYFKNYFQLWKIWK